MGGSQDVRRAWCVAMVAVLVAAVGYGQVPLADRLEGEFPIGHWECWFEQSDFAETAKTNNPFLPQRCNIATFHNATAIEMSPGGLGHILAIETEDKTNHAFDPDEAFRIHGAWGRLYSIASRMRWTWDEGPGDWEACHDPDAAGCLTVQTTRNDRFSAKLLSPDIVRLKDDHYGTKRLLFRAGTAASRQMVRFRDCVQSNRSRLLFDVVQCVNPLPAEDARG